MTWRGRLAWLVVFLIAQILYIPINRTVQGGVTLSTPWDASIPLWPIWAVPYLLSIPWWAGSAIWAAWKMDDTRYRAFIAAGIAVTLSAYVVYIVYPTYVLRPTPMGDDWLTGLVRQIYDNDALYNAFPSGHAYNTLLILFFWWHWQPKWRWLWVGLAAIVILSTLFTRQHNLPDPVGGLLWAVASYRFGWWWVKQRREL